MSNKLGNKANWSVPYVSDRPREILNLNQTQEDKVKSFIGFSGRNSKGEETNTYILETLETSVNLSDFASCPVGTIILTPKVSGIAFYQRIANTGVIANDWNKIVKSAI